MWGDDGLTTLWSRERSWSTLVKPELHPELLWEFALKFSPWDIWLFCLSPCTGLELLSTLYSRLCRKCPPGSWLGKVDGKPKGSPWGKARRCGNWLGGAMLRAPIGWGTTGTTGWKEVGEIASLLSWKGHGRRFCCPELGSWFKLSGFANPELFGVDAIREWSNRTDINTVGWVGNVLYWNKRKGKWTYNTWSYALQLINRPV